VIDGEVQLGKKVRVKISEATHNGLNGIITS